MKKTTLFLAFSIMAYGAISAQELKKPFFGKVKDVEALEQPGQSISVFAKVTPTDSTFMSLRPVTGIAYSFPNNQAQ